MDKLDLRKVYQHLYQPSAKKVDVVEVPAFNFVMIGGAIEPGAVPGTSPAFKQAMEALYGISYGLKFMSKLRKDNPIDYPVMTLEAQWWVEEGVFDIQQPGNWHWTAMMMQPEHITGEMYQSALTQLRKKKDNPALDKLRFEPFHEGLCLQMMHIGPYSREMETIAKIDAFAEQNGYHLHGKHHEIYLGDPMRSDPAKLKTALRHPAIRKNPFPG